MLKNLNLNGNKLNFSFYYFSYFLIYSVILFLYIKNFYYLKDLFYTHHGDSAFFADLLYRIAIFNDYNASTIFSSAYYFFEYLVKEPEAFCSIESLSNSKKFNMYVSSHLYWIAWILSFPIRLGLDPILLSSFLIVSAYFSLILIIIFIFFKYKVDPFLCVLLILLVIFSWKPIIEGLYGQFYFDKFFIPLMILFIFTHQNIIFNKKKFLILYTLGILTLSVHERSALMLSGYIIANELFNKIQNFRKYNLDKGLIFFSILSLFYFFIYIKFYQDSIYSGNISFGTAIYYIKEYLTFEKRTFFLVNKLVLVCAPLFVVSIFAPKMAIISFGALIPNILFSVGGAEKIGFSTHYHTYYIPFLIAAVVLSSINFCKKNYDLKKKFIFHLVVLFMFIFNLSINASDTKRSLELENPKFNNNLLYSITNKNEIYLLKFAEFKKKLFQKTDLEKKSISMPESLMTGFVKTKVRVDYFPIGIYSNEFIIITKNKQKYNEYLINFPYFLNKEKYMKIHQCFSNYIEKNFEIFFKTEFGGSDYFIYKRI